jgi:hypothetical protein
MKHVYIRLKQDLSDTQRLILQACLGSDFRKEVISLVRIREGGEAFISLFETPEEALRVEEWRLQGE